MASKPYSCQSDETDDPRAISAQARGIHLDNPDATHAAQLGKGGLFPHDFDIMCNAPVAVGA
jgi:hypothetical protein